MYKSQYFNFNMEEHLEKKIGTLVELCAIIQYAMTGNFEHEFPATPITIFSNYKVELGQQRKI